MTKVTRRIKLADGSDGYVVPVNTTPKRFWEKYTGLWSMGVLPDQELFRFSEEKLRAYLPDKLAHVADGGFNKNLAYKAEYKDYYVWIPAEFFEPDENEYGPISL